MQKPPTVTGQQILNLIRQQDYRCALTGRALTPETASLDHTMPLSRGGAHDISNLQVLDYQANTAKGSLTVDEFVELCRDVVGNIEHTEGVVPSPEN